MGSTFETSLSPKLRFASLAAVGVVLLAGLAAAVAPPATAATANVTLTGVQASGTVGVPQSLVVTAAIDGARCGSVLAPNATILATANGSTQNVGTATFTTCVGSVYQYSFQWLPAAAGAVFLTASVVDSTSTAARSAIAPVTTTTRITVADTVRLGVPTTLTASVTANGGSLASPQGTIQFSVVGGGTTRFPRRSRCSGHRLSSGRRASWPRTRQRPSMERSTPRAARVVAACLTRCR